MNAHRLLTVVGVMFATWTFAVFGCRTSLDTSIDPNVDGGGFTCTDDADCGDGWHCNTACHADGFSPVCLPNAECNPCPSLAADPDNCGACGHACGGTASCFDGVCVGS